MLAEDRPPLGVMPVGVAGTPGTGRKMDLLGRPADPASLTAAVLPACLSLPHVRPVGLLTNSDSRRQTLSRHVSGAAYSNHAELELPRSAGSSQLPARRRGHSHANTEPRWLERRSGGMAWISPVSSAPRLRLDKPWKAAGLLTTVWRCGSTHLR